MKLKARQYLRYNRKPVSAGEAFEAAASDARILMAIGKAEVYVEPVKKVAAVFKPIPTITADVPASASVVAAESEVQSTPTKRGYKRRDMTAEE